MKELVDHSKGFELRLPLEGFEQGVTGSDLCLLVITLAATRRQNCHGARDHLRSKR